MDPRFQVANGVEMETNETSAVEFGRPQSDLLPGNRSSDKTATRTTNFIVSGDFARIWSPKPVRGVLFYFFDNTVHVYFPPTFSTIARPVHPQNIMFCTKLGKKNECLARIRSSF